jgi:hypothetical protein
MDCEVCGQEEAAFTIIPTGQGMPQSLGAACFARAGLELAKAILPAEEIADTLGPMFVKPPTDPEAKAAHKATIRGRKSKAPEPDAAQGPVGGPDEIPAAAADGGD